MFGGSWASKHSPEREELFMVLKLFTPYYFNNERCNP